jgi:hypothetical protein
MLCYSLFLYKKISMTKVAQFLDTFYTKQISTVICTSGYQWGLDWQLDLLNTYTHNSQLQVTITLIIDLHTLQITTAYAKSFQTAFTSCFLIMDLNNGDSSASVITSLPAG